jgi:glycosyltransferase involved in cell wall biosynthesis
MKIAYFTDTFMPELNGVTNTLSKLRGFLEKRGIQYAFFAPAYGKKNPGEGVRLDSPGVYRFGGLKTTLSPESRLAFPRTREIGGLCDTFNPDLVHVITELGIGRQGLKYARSRGLPLVMSYHTDYGKYLRYFHLDFLRPLVERYLAGFYRFAHQILAPSRYTLEELSRGQYRNLGLWSRGIDAGKFSPRFRSGELRKSLGVDGKFVFLYVGRLSPPAHNRELWPWIRKSVTPPLFTPTTGKPLAKASRGSVPKVSVPEGKAKQSQEAYIRDSSWPLLNPVRITLSKPRRRIVFSQGPPPVKIKAVFPGKRPRIISIP